MKRNLLYLLVFIILLAVAGYLLNEDTQTTTLQGPENYSFAIKDTAAITKIVISDKSPSSATIKRSGKSWILEGGNPVRRDAIEVLLETLYRMELKSFISPRLVPEVERQLAVYGKKVEVYAGERLVKVLYVGLPTPSEMGTYMKLESGDLPYAVHIPGFNGFLNTRFISEPYLWRSRDLVRMNTREIREVEMIYSDSVNASFKLRVFSPDSMYLVSVENNEILENLSPVKAKLFLAACAKLKYEGEIIPSDPIYARRDSLLASTPAFTLKVRSLSGDETKISGYRIVAAPETIDYNDPSSFFDPDRLHGFINNDRMVLLQFYGLRNVLKSKTDLLQ